MSDTQDPQRRWMICAVCGYPLERSSNPAMFEGAEWGHINPLQQDHVIIPVDAADMPFNQRCDFCHQVDATMLVLADSFMMAPRSRSVGNWAACPHCADLVKRRRWSELVSYVRDHGAEQARGAPRKILADMYRLLEVHMRRVITMEEFKARGGYPLDVD